MIICWPDLRNMKNMRNIFIDWYTAIDQPEVAYMKKLQVRSQQKYFLIS